MTTQEKQDKPVIAISIGDINGIGPEVVFKTFSDKRIFNYVTPLLYCCKNLISYYANIIDLSELDYENVKNPKKLNPSKLNLFCNWQNEIDSVIHLGTPTEISGKYALKSLQAAMFAIKNQLADALVTAPINKKNIHSTEFPFPGHSEYLMKEAGASSYLMLMVSEEMKVGLVTGHLPFRKIPEALTEELILEKLNIFHKSLIIDFAISQPKIAVLGLNPHAGDDGLLGSEENDIIIPAIKKSFSEGLNVFGPFGADGFFGSREYLKYDGILAMYHDQGLTPFKTVMFDHGVNFTAGLPFVRTSPVHGTAYPLAGKGLANENSFRESVFLALQILRNRKMYEELSKNPLQTRILREREVEEE